VSVLMFDLDHFKSINDTFGHPVGDEALRLFATTASANMRAADVVGRFGGEEFVAILPGNLADATVAGERVRTASSWRRATSPGRRSAAR
jgi:diguanylate cyclase (GGDEF)-like protein